MMRNSMIIPSVVGCAVGGSWIYIANNTNKIPEWAKFDAEEWNIAAGLVGGLAVTLLLMSVLNNNTQYHNRIRSGFRNIRSTQPSNVSDIEMRSDSILREPF